MTNPSSLRNTLDVHIAEANMSGDNSSALKTIEKQVVDLALKKDRLQQLGLLTDASNNRHANAMKILDNAMKEVGTDGLTERELASMFKGTYATIKQAEVSLDLEFDKIKKISEFNKPLNIDKYYFEF